MTTRPSRGRLSRMQLVLVSGLSGSGKSIVLTVLEDAGFYCVDNLPATLLQDVVRFLSDAGHTRVAVSVDARSAALPALPEALAQLKRSGVDCRSRRSAVCLFRSTPGWSLREELPCRSVRLCGGIATAECQK